MQGAEAADSVVRALTALGRCSIDAIVIVRGGGSRNELAVFDAEAIARAIAAMPVPVITGIGHEIDRSIADLVAHTMLKTPTACAGHLVERVRASLGDVESVGDSDRPVCARRTRQQRAEGVAHRRAGAARRHPCARRRHVRDPERC